VTAGQFSIDRHAAAKWCLAERDGFAFVDGQAAIVTRELEFDEPQDLRFERIAN
jgi:hypothetical protein